MIKFIKYTLISILVFIVVINASLYILLNIPSIQRKITTFATETLKKQLNTEVRIKSVDFAFMNKVALKEVYIEDQRHRVLLDANKIAVGLNPIELLYNRLIINTIQLYSFHLYLSKDTPKSKPNYQFVLDAFKSDSTKKTKPLAEVQIKSIVIRRGNVNYDVFSEPYKFGRFNATHVRLRNLLANISLHTFTQDNIDAVIKRLAFEENSGFTVKKLTMHLISTHKKVSLNNFKLEMPQSNLAFDNVSLDYSKVDATHKFNDVARFNVEIPDGTLCPHDIAAFVPTFRYYYSVLHLETAVKGTVNNLNISKINVSSGDKLSLSARLRLDGTSDMANAYLFGKINKLRIDPAGTTELVRNLSARRTDLGEWAQRAGVIEFSGEVSGFLSDLVAFGMIKSSLGVLKTDLKIGQDTESKRMTFNGKLVTQDFALGRLLANQSLGNIGLNLQLDGYQDPKQLPQGKVKGEIFKVDFNNYQYRNIRINGDFQGSLYKGNLELNDPNGYFYLGGIVDSNPRNQKFKLISRVRNLDLNALNLSKQYRGSRLSFTMKADLNGKLPDQALGEVSIDSLHFQDSRNDLSLGRITVQSLKEGGLQRLRIASPLINGELKGKYQISALPHSLLFFASQYFPSLTHKVFPVAPTNDFDFSFQISNTEKVGSVFNLPVTFSDDSYVKGAYSDFSHKFFTEAYVPTFTMKNKTYNDVKLFVDNENQQLHLSAGTYFQNKKKDNISFSFNMMAQSDMAECKLDWSNSAKHTYSGELNFKTAFKERFKGAPGMNFTIMPGSFILNDSTWNIAQSTVVVDSGRVSVRDFSLSKLNQFVKIDGSVSKNPEDTLYLSLKNINLEYVFNTLNIKNVNFGGKATGDFILTNLMRTPVLLTENFEVEDFSFNQVRFGRLNLFSRWNSENNGIQMQGGIMGYLGNKSKVNGYIFPTKDSISMNFNASQLNVEFLKPYLGGILKDLSGQASGNAQLFGHFSNLNLSGDVKTDKLRFKVDYLNTYYSISDSLHLRRNQIYFNNINVLDKEKNVAIASGMIRHNDLSNWRYSIQMTTPKMLVYDAARKNNPMFYGPVYGSGNVTIKGDEKVTDIDVNMQTNAGTNFTISLNDERSATEYNFITFRNKKQELLELQRRREEVSDIAVKSQPVEKAPPASSSILNLNLFIDINPAANLNLLMDPVLGDMIESHGLGNMKLVYSTNKDVQLFGLYTIERGTYGFNWQNVFKKKFTISEGSSVSFNGSPYSADLDINAMYTTTADLADLDENFVNDKELSRTSTQVQCLLKATGNMNKPDLKFDLNFPNNSEEVNRRVKSIVNTEDMMARQIVYLMLMNRFYTLDYSNSGSTNRQSQIGSIASATIGSQLNNLLSQVTDKVNIGTNVKLDNTNNYNNMEVQVALSSQLLNNRLLINGNFGYRDNIATKTSFIGDFDLEYKLTKSGEWRAKVYNHSNDRYYYLKSSLTTQGLGIIYKKDFNALHDLFRKPESEKK